MIETMGFYTQKMMIGNRPFVRIKGKNRDERNITVLRSQFTAKFSSIAAKKRARDSAESTA